ncbi:MAG TPA: hypothetical protein VKA48_04935, partial [Gammaproteobacteria bacterium]|nr:hypothetical protein [Gammaproteobacteria bacterium]
HLSGVDAVTVDLKGRARIPESIPRYLRAVAAQSTFRKGHFEDLSAKHPSEKEGGKGGRDLLTFHSRTRFHLNPVGNAEAKR